MGAVPLPRPHDEAAEGEGPGSQLPSCGCPARRPAATSIFRLSAP